MHTCVHFFPSPPTSRLFPLVSPCRLPSFTFSSRGDQPCLWCPLGEGLCFGSLSWGYVTSGGGGNFMKLRGGTELGGGIIQVFSRGGGTLGLKVWGTGILVPGPRIQNLYKFPSFKITIKCSCLSSFFYECRILQAGKIHKKCNYLYKFYLVNCKQAKSSKIISEKYSRLI